MAEQNKIQAIVFKKEKGRILYLLLKRISSKGGFWQPITGRCEKKEFLLEAAKRELKEETGIEKIKNIIENFYSFYFENLKTKEIAFGFEVYPKTKINLDKNIYPEHNKYKWCEFDEAIKLLKWVQNKISLTKLNAVLTKN